MAHYGYCFSVERLRFSAHLGFYDDERARPQPVELSLRLYFEHAPACVADDHASFIDYAALADRCAQVVKTHEFRLVEFMAQEVFSTARAYMDAHGGAAAKLWLKLTKCEPPIPYAQQGASFVLSDLPAGATIIQV